LAAQEHVTVYLHLKSHDGFYAPMPVTLYREHSFLKELSQHASILTMYVGGLLVLMLYNFLLFSPPKNAASCSMLGIYCAS